MNNYNININMIYNVSTILREIYNNTNKTNNIIVSSPNPFGKKNMVRPNYNLKVNTELANQKSLELYEKYNTYRKARPISFFPIIKSNLDTDTDTDKDTDTNTRFAFYIKNGLIIGGFLMLLACFPQNSYSYTYFKK
jgi:hypothetical protein